LQVFDFFGDTRETIDLRAIIQANVVLLEGHCLINARWHDTA